MTHLENIIGTLLLRNNCVIIPSFGGFVANSVSAKIDVESGLIHPPKKAVSFNRSLNNNDGLIIHHLAKEEGISYDEAQQIINQEVQEIKHLLKKEQRVHFTNVGFLYVNNSGKIAFEQDRFFNLLLSSFGLGNVQFIEEKVEEPVLVSTPVVTIEQEDTTEEKAFIAPIVTIDTPPSEKVEEKEIIHPAAENKTSRGVISKIVRYTAVAALVPLLFYSFWIPMNTDVLQSRMLFTEDFNPFKSKESYQYNMNDSAIDIDSVLVPKTLSSITENLNSEAKTFVYPLDDDLFIPVNREISETTLEEAIDNTVINNAITEQKINGYHIIAGCFGNQNNAENLVKNLKSQGFDAYEVDVKGGLHRISAGFVSNQTEIQKLRNQLSQEGITTWVLKK